MEAREREKQDIKVDAKAIPEADYEIGCSVLASSIRCFFEKPGIKEEYDRWLNSEKCLSCSGT